MGTQMETGYFVTVEHGTPYDGELIWNTKFTQRELNSLFYGEDAEREAYASYRIYTPDRADELPKMRDGVYRVCLYKADLIRQHAGDEDGATHWYREIVEDSEELRCSREFEVKTERVIVWGSHGKN